LILTYAFVAVGLSLCWGAGGILSLGQGCFFGLGGYCMAMFLKLEASTPENTEIQSTPGIPDFMDWNQLTELPLWWTPFYSLTLTFIAIVLVPMTFAFIIGVAMFRRRVGGVYFAIITQAFAAILTILIIGQQGYTGGVNGITDLRTLKGWDIRTDSAKEILYYVNGVLLFVVLFIAHFVKKSKLGRVLIAMRDQEDRVRFSGYDVASFKIFIFCLGAGFAGVGGAMFTLQVGFMSPTLVGIVPSIEMVIFCAVGGRLSIIGAVYGALLVNWAKTSFSESFPELWLFGLGGQALDHTQNPRTREERGHVMSEPRFLLTVEGLTVSFDGFKAVDDLNFYVEPNECRVIIGPNGAGKTTVLDLICGRTKATDGSVRFKNHELLNMREDQIVHAGVGRKFQTPSVYEDLSVFENLEISYPKGYTVFGALAFRRDDTVKKRIQEIAETIFLEALLEEKAAFLSHGQKQWLEIGMLLIQDPELLMLDEPVAGMSVAERKKTAELLNRIIQDRSVIVIEHDMGFVEDIATRVNVLHQGKMLSEGSMAHVKADPNVIEVYLGH